MLLPKEKVYVAVLENSDTGLADPDVVARKAAAIAVGRYALAPEVYLEVTREGDKFFARVTGFRKLAMLSMSETAFFPNDVDAEVHFSKNASGKSEQLLLRQEGQDMPAKRVN